MCLCVCVWRALCRTHTNPFVCWHSVFVFTNLFCLVFTTDFLFFVSMWVVDAAVCAHYSQLVSLLALSLAFLSSIEMRTYLPRTTLHTICQIPPQSTHTHTHTFTTSFHMCVCFPLESESALCVSTMPCFHTKFDVVYYYFLFFFSSNQLHGEIKFIWDFS